MAQFFADRIALGSHRAKTPEGYLLCTGVPFARTGIQLYRESEIVQGGDPSKKVKVLRTAEEVFDPATLASFEGKPITSPHPPQFITPDNWAHYAKGHVQNVRTGPKLADGEHALIGDLVITDSSLIPKIESNLITELSAGYSVEYTPDPHASDVYKQTSIRGNHIAVVPTGRAGDLVKILDSEESIMDPVSAVDDKVSVSALTALLRVFGYGRANDAAGSEDTVSAEERAKARVQDEKEKEEKLDKAKQEATDAGLKLVADALNRQADAFDKYTAALDKKSKDEDEEKKAAEEKKKAEDAEKEKEKEKEKEEEGGETSDADLIPVATLSAAERPNNPIPGSDKALDSLRALKPFIAMSKDRKVIDAYNEAVTALKTGGVPTGDAYKQLLGTERPALVDRAESRVGVTDANGADDFVAKAANYHRRNIVEAAAEAAGKETK
jgi:hypothetical protein